MTLASVCFEKIDHFIIHFIIQWRSLHCIITTRKNQSIFVLFPSFLRVLLLFIFFNSINYWLIIYWSVRLGTVLCALYTGALIMGLWIIQCSVMSLQKFVTWLTWYRSQYIPMWVAHWLQKWVKYICCFQLAKFSSMTYRYKWANRVFFAILLLWLLQCINSYQQILDK